MNGLSRLLIVGTFTFDDIWWHEEANAPIGATALLDVFGIVLLVHNVIVQKSRFFAACVGDERLFLGHFQFEGVSQELSELLLDCLCFFSRASKAEERIIRIA